MEVNIYHPDEAFTELVREYARDKVEWQLDTFERKVREERSEQVKQEVMVQGVYVLYGSELVFKEIVPLSTYSTFVLCDPNPEEDATFNGETIKLYDEVVVGGTDLYDGKIV